MVTPQPQMQMPESEILYILEEIKQIIPPAVKLINNNNTQLQTIIKSQKKG